MAQRFRVNLAGFANAFPEPPFEGIWTPGTRSNPAGGTYATVRTYLLHQVRIQTMYFDKAPTEDDLADFHNYLVSDGEMQASLTGETDSKEQADMAYAQYVQWVAKQREP